MSETDRGSAAAPPDGVTMRQGTPTRVEIDGRRYRFGITSTNARAGTAHVTVLADEQLVGFDVAADRLVSAAGHQWRVERVDLSRPNRARVRLLRIGEPT